MSPLRAIEFGVGALAVGAGVGWWVHPGAGVIALGVCILLDSLGIGDLVQTLGHAILRRGASG